MSAQAFTTATNGAVQRSTEPVMRGRAMASILALARGGTAIVSWVAGAFGPRWALGAGAASGFAAAVVRICCPMKYHRTIRGPGATALKPLARR